MRPDQIKQQINLLDLSEQLLLVEEIWDSIAKNNAAIPLAQWQQKALDERYKDYQSNRLELHNFQSVHQELRNKFK